MGSAAGCDGCSDSPGRSLTVDHAVSQAVRFKTDPLATGAAIGRGDRLGHGAGSGRAGSAW